MKAGAAVAVVMVGYSSGVFSDGEGAVMWSPILLVLTLITFLITLSGAESSSASASALASLETVVVWKKKVSHEKFSHISDSDQ